MVHRILWPGFPCRMDLSSLSNYHYLGQDETNTTQLVISMRDMNDNNANISTSKITLTCRIISVSYLCCSQMTNNWVTLEFNIYHRAEMSQWRPWSVSCSSYDTVSAWCLDHYSIHTVVLVNTAHHRSTAMCQKSCNKMVASTIQSCYLQCTWTLTC